jgi:hypothetical protein
MRRMAAFQYIRTGLTGQEPGAGMVARVELLVEEPALIMEELHIG